MLLLFYMKGEPRQMAKGCGGNGVKAWRKSKQRSDSHEEVDHWVAMIRPLQPPWAKDLKDR